MDIVLELFDTFVFDSIYATVLPAKAPAFTANATLATLDPPLAHNAWEYAPSTQYISFQPGPAAYMSQWTRDDWRRQGLSLYLITWYVYLHC
jgi:lathosterol oxidase